MVCGTNRLLKQGAILVTNTKDIINSFKDIKYKENDKKGVAVNFNTIPEKYKEVYRIVENNHLDINEISRKIGKNISETNSLIFMMELEEYIEKSADGTYKQKEW